MSKNWNYVSGDWNVVCDVCSKKIKASEAKQRWDGFIVCKDDYEQRQPLDFIRARQDKISVPFTRPVPPDTFVPQNFTESYTDQVYQIEEKLERVVAYIREFTDSITFSDGITSYDYGRGLDDPIALSEVLDFLLVSMLDLADSTSPSDAITIAIDKALSDNTTVADGLTTLVAKVLADTATTTDVLQYLLERQLSDSALITDTLSMGVNTSIADTIIFSDLLTSTIISSTAINGSSVNNQALN